MEKYGYIVLKANGDIELHDSDQVDFTLEELQKAVGGYIQIVRGCITQMLLVIDDEGKLKNKPVNPLATMLYAPGIDCIVGDVVIGTSFNADPYAEPDVYKFPWETAVKHYGILMRMV